MNRFKKLNPYYFRWMSVVLSTFSFVMFFATHFLKCISIIDGTVIYYRASQVFFHEEVAQMTTLNPARIGLVGFIFIAVSLILMFVISFKKIGNNKKVSHVLTCISILLLLLATLFIILIPASVKKANPSFASLYALKISTPLLLSIIALIINILSLAFIEIVTLWPSQKK